MNYRNELIVLALSMGGLACGPAAADAEPGRETGSCVEHECLGDLVCLSDLCVDPFATPTGDGDPTDGNEDADDSGGPPPPPLSSVSILVVVDNSGSMGEEQQAVASSLSGLPGALDAAGIDWRIGITTTDNGNPWCQGTGAEAGRLVLSSCRSRLTQFTFMGAQVIEAQEACEDICPPEWESIQMEPSSIAGEPGAQARPWVESIGGATNLPPGLSLADAMNCLVPQGINGCGFEQPLESMRKAIQRTDLDIEDSHGFIPDGSLLVVLIVTDEADCSYNEDFESIFLPDGEKVFWSDPATPSPSSAACWNAGTDCSGGDCVSADYNFLGSQVAPDQADTEAVLWPMSRYVDGLNEFDSALVMLIGGTRTDGTVIYQEARDPQFQSDFGIGPGCEGVGGRAVPPVRMREFAAEFSEGGGQNMFSVCEVSHDAAVGALVASIENRLP